MSSLYNALIVAIVHFNGIWDMNTSNEINVLSVEIFAAKDLSSMFLSAPRNCGLKEADTLRIDGLEIVAMQGSTVLPIDFPSLTESGKVKLVHLVSLGKRISVGEFTGRGLFDAYFLNLLIVDGDM